MTHRVLSFSNRKIWFGHRKSTKMDFRFYVKSPQTCDLGSVGINQIYFSFCLLRGENTLALSWHIFFQTYFCFKCLVATSILLKNGICTWIKSLICTSSCLSLREGCGGTLQPKPTHIGSFVLGVSSVFPGFMNEQRTSTKPSDSVWIISARNLIITEINTFLHKKQRIVLQLPNVDSCQSEHTKQTKNKKVKTTS